MAGRKNNFVDLTRRSMQNALTICLSYRAVQLVMFADIQTLAYANSCKKQMLKNRTLSSYSKQGVRTHQRAVRR